MTRSRILTVFSAVAVFLLCVMLPAVLSAEEISDPDFGYTMDIPEGYSVAGYTPDGMSYQFKHDRLPVELVLKLYTSDIYPDAVKALSGTLSRLSAENIDVSSFQWCASTCAAATFDSKVLREGGASGWGVSSPLPGKDACIVLLCYADSAKADDCLQFIISTLNSLNISAGNSVTPGILTTMAYPESSPKTINLNIAGKKITTTIGEEDAAASEFLISCEYAVFKSIVKMYKDPEIWNKAWLRYYRAIYRDSYSRLNKAAFDINSALYPLALKKNQKHPEIAVNEMILNWIQTFEYKDTLDENDTGFTNLTDCITGAGSDCDSRSMLGCILLKHFGINTVLFVSTAYSHAVYGAKLDQDGAKIEVNGDWYLLNETTVKNLKPGLIAQDFSDTEKWTPVSFN